MYSLKMYANKAVWRDGIELMLAKTENGKLYFAEEALSFKEAENDIAIHQAPTITLTMTEAQFLMDELWNCGLRPSEGTGSAGAFAAKEAHLKDLQKILDHVLPVALKSSV